MINLMILIRYHNGSCSVSVLIQRLANLDENLMFDARRANSREVRLPRGYLDFYLRGSYMVKI